MRAHFAILDESDYFGLVEKLYINFNALGDDLSDLRNENWKNIRVVFDLKKVRTINIYCIL